MPAIRQRDSVGRAEVRRKRWSRWWVRVVSRSVGLGGGDISGGIWARYRGAGTAFATMNLGFGIGGWSVKGMRGFLTQFLRCFGGNGEAYRPASNAGEARGESSVVIVKMPSNFLSGLGVVIVAEVRARTLNMKDGLVCHMRLVTFNQQLGTNTAYLVFPTRTSATPYSSSKEISMSL